MKTESGMNEFEIVCTTFFSLKAGLASDNLIVLFREKCKKNEGKMLGFLKRYHLQ